MGESWMIEATMVKPIIICLFGVFLLYLGYERYSEEDEYNMGLIIGLITGGMGTFLLVMGIKCFLRYIKVI